MAELPQKPNPFQPGFQLSVDELNRVVDMVKRQLLGTGGTLVGQYGDRQVVQYRNTSSVVPAVNNYLKQFVVLQEFYDYLLCAPFLYDNDGTQILSQTYNPSLGQDSNTPVYVAKPYMLQDTPWNGAFVQDQGGTNFANGEFPTLWHYITGRNNVGTRFCLTANVFNVAGTYTVTLLSSQGNLNISAACFGAGAGGTTGPDGTFGGGGGAASSTTLFGTLPIGAWTLTVGKGGAPGVDGGASSIRVAGDTMRAPGGIAEFGGAADTGFGLYDNFGGGNGGSPLGDYGGGGGQCATVGPLPSIIGPGAPGSDGVNATDDGPGLGGGHRGFGAGGAAAGLSLSVNGSSPGGGGGGQSVIDGNIMAAGSGTDGLCAIVFGRNRSSGGPNPQYPGDLGQVISPSYRVGDIIVACKMPTGYYTADSDGALTVPVEWMDINTAGRTWSTLGTTANVSVGGIAMSIRNGIINILI